RSVVEIGPESDDEKETSAPERGLRSRHGLHRRRADLCRSAIFEERVVLPRAIEIDERISLFDDSGPEPRVQERGVAERHFAVAEPAFHEGCAEPCRVLQRTTTVRAVGDAEPRPQQLHAARCATAELSTPATCEPHESRGASLAA